MKQVSTKYEASMETVSGKYAPSITHVSSMPSSCHPQEGLRQPSGMSKATMACENMYSDKSTGNVVSGIVSRLQIASTCQYHNTLLLNHDCGHGSIVAMVRVLTNNSPVVVCVP